MLNLEKIRLMTRLTVYEEGLGTDDKKTARFFKNDYVFGAMVGSFACGTLAWGICAAVYCCYNFEQIFFSVYENSLGPVLRLAVVSYGEFIVFFLAVTFLIYRTRSLGYSERRELYEQDLDTLLDLYERERAGMERGRAPQKHAEGT